MTAGTVTPSNSRAGAKRSGPGSPAPQAHAGTDTSAPGRVAEIQRQRILGAMAEVAAQWGAANVTVAHVVARAGISRRTFYELFDDREACLLAALDEAISEAAKVVVPAYQAEPATAGSRPAWRERIRAGLAALLQFLEEEPELGRLCVVEALGAGDRALERRAQCMSALILAVDQGREEVKRGRTSGELPPMTAEGVVGGVFAIVHARILLRGSAGRRGGAAAPLTALLGPLMGAIVLPYLGPAAAQQELHKPAPSLKKKKTRGRRDPLEGLDMRLTYRTVRVLMACAARPGASNRQVAEGSGISDQGQISKLLARLEGLGLILNSGKGQPKGAPNAWRLTPRGEEVEGAIRLQTAGP